MGIFSIFKDLKMGAELLKDENDFMYIVAGDERITTKRYFAKSIAEKGGGLNSLLNYTINNIIGSGYELSKEYESGGLFENDNDSSILLTYQKDGKFITMTIYKGILDLTLMKKVLKIVDNKNRNIIRENVKKYSN